MSNVRHVTFPWHHETAQNAPILKDESQPTLEMLEILITDTFDCFVSRGKKQNLRLNFEGWDSDNETRITLYTVPSKNQGIHLTGGFDDKSDLELRLTNAIEDALKDGFAAIYIHDFKFNANDEVQNG